jgi:DNA-binding CsgD family transcriptional regulator
LSARLDPLLGRAREGGSGLLRVDVIARDGTIVYSDLASRRGQVVSPLAEPLLAGALAGTSGASVRPLDSPAGPAEPAAAARGDVVRADVPISAEGKVAGVFVLYQELPAAPRGPDPVIGGLVTAALAGLLRLAMRLRRQVWRWRALGDGGHVGGRQERRPRAVEAAPLQPRPLEPRPADAKLTRRELDVLRLLAEDRTYRDISGELIVSEETVRTHVKSILRKLGQPDRLRAVRAARFENLL